jgi:hypothetical protein
VAVVVCVFPSIPNAGCWMLDAGCWMLDAVIVFSMLDAQYWMFVLWKNNNRDTEDRFLSDPISG